MLQVKPRFSNASWGAHTREGEVSVGGVAIGNMSRQQIARLMAVVPPLTSLGFAFTAYRS